MEENKNWKVFETTGSVADYLKYKQEYRDTAQRNEGNEQYEAGGNHSAGYDSSKYTYRGL